MIHVCLPPLDIDEEALLFDKDIAIESENVVSTVVSIDDMDT